MEPAVMFHHIKRKKMWCQSLSIGQTNRFLTVVILKEPGSECTFLYWLSLMVLKVQSLTLSEWQIGMVLGLGRSQHTQAINSCPPHPPSHLAVGTLSLWWELWVINCQWMTCMNNGQVKPIPHTSSAVWGCGALWEQCFSHVEWFQFSLGDNSCSIMEQCTIIGHQNPME